MTSINFLTNGNLQLLWDVLLDQDIVKNEPKNIKNILDIFNQNLQGFYENEKKYTANLIDLNKKYITLILNFISKRLIPIKQEKQISYPIEKQLITIEEIKGDRISQFDKDLNRRREEFTNSMTLNTPPLPDFIDKTRDEPLNEIELEIKKITNQRNYDIEQLNKTQSLSVDNWLKPKETSVKNEKMSYVNQANQANSKLKYIKIENQELDNIFYKNQIIDLNEQTKKHITWADKMVENEIEDNFFKKLKKVDEVTLLKEDIKQINTKIEEMNNNIKNLMEILKVSEV